MATIERKPLPPPNSTAVTITEADRAEIMACANAVVDYYLNGPGSYWDAGPRKPLVSGDEGMDSTVQDLKRFKDGVIASKQFADDPYSIMDSIIDFIDRTTAQVTQTAQDHEVKDKILRSPPHTDDPINDPKVISPRLLNNAAEPISLEGDQAALQPRAGGASGISGSEPTRFLSGKIVSRLPPTVFSNMEEAPSRVGIAGGQDDAQSIRALSRCVVPEDRFGDGRDSSNSNGSPIPMLEQYIRYLNRSNSA